MPDPAANTRTTALKAPSRDALAVTELLNRADQDDVVRPAADVQTPMLARTVEFPALGLLFRASQRRAPEKRRRVLDVR